MNTKSTITTNSLISREASTAIKGLMILLVVLGHTGMLNTDFATGEKTFFYSWFHYFRVEIFMILPFIYGYRQAESERVLGMNGWCVNMRKVWGDIKRNLVRIGIPYCWVFVLSLLVFVTVGGGSFKPQGVLYTFISGSQALMNKYIGFHFVWFLPAMMALTTLKSLWYNSSRPVRGSLLAVSVVLWLLAIIGILPQKAAMYYVPFSLTQAFYYLLLGLVSRQLVKRLSLKKAMPWIVVLIVAVTAMMYFQKMGHWPKVIQYTAFYRLVFPLLMFLPIYAMGGWLSKSKFLTFAGKYSFQIYLVHVFVINALEVVLLHFFNQSIGLGIVIYVVALAISSGLSVLMVKVSVINKVLFPKGWFCNNSSKC